MKYYEALEWLKSNNNPTPFATNRFGGAINAIEFIERLYKLGAKKINIFDIMDEPERIAEEGGAYASTLLVELPTDTEKREKIIQVYNEEIEEYDLNEGEEFEGWDENILVFWWD